MDLPCAHEILGCIYEKIPISIESIYWHWRFERDPDWGSRKDKNRESDTDPLSHSASLPGTPLFENPLSTTSSPEIQISPINASSTEDPSPIQNPTSLAPPTRFLLDPRLQEIEEPLVVTPRGRPSGSLNKKHSRKDNTFDRSTQRKPSRFEHVSFLSKSLGERNKTSEPPLLTFNRALQNFPKR